MLRAPGQTSFARFAEPETRRLNSLINRLHLPFADQAGETTQISVHLTVEVIPKINVQDICRRRENLTLVAERRVQKPLDARFFVCAKCAA